MVSRAWLRCGNFTSHKLDDFPTVGPPQLACLPEQYRYVYSAFEDWGIPLHLDRLGMVLGVGLGLLALRARFPLGRFKCFISLLGAWSSKRRCMRRELESLVGSL